MKKTISALLIAVLLITLAVSPVLGEESFPLTVMALEDELQEYWAKTLISSGSTRMVCP